MHDKVNRNDLWVQQSPRTAETATKVDYIFQNALNDELIVSSLHSLQRLIIMVAWADPKRFDQWMHDKVNRNDLWVQQSPRTAETATKVDYIFQNALNDELIVSSLHSLQRLIIMVAWADPSLD